MDNWNSNSLLKPSDVIHPEIRRIQQLLRQQEEDNAAELEDLEKQIKVEEEHNREYKKLLGMLRQDDSEENERLKAGNQQLLTEIAAMNQERDRLTLVLEDLQRTFTRFKFQEAEETERLTVKAKALETEITDTHQAVNNMEHEFNKVHQKYEKCKEVLEVINKAEKKLGATSDDLKKNLGFFNNNLAPNLKEQFTLIKERHQKDLMGELQSNRIQVAKMQAVLKSLELQGESLGGSVLLRSREIEDLCRLNAKLLSGLEKLTGTPW